MVQTREASPLSLAEIESKLALQSVYESDFFPEWQVEPVSLTDYERQLLDRAKQNFLYLKKFPVHEELVKLIVLSPLLDAAGFYQRPFRPVAEKRVKFELPEEDLTVRGRIDLLILKEQFWVAVVESKNKRISVEEALPQALLYMSRTPQPVLYALLTNGSECVFIKLDKQPPARYGFSRQFALVNPGNDLYQVVAILRHLALT